MKCTSHSSQSGSALLLILIAVVLFAALSYTVAGMMRSNGGTSISEEQAKIYAGEILDYGRSMRQAVQALRINGCSETEISFENNIVSGYTNGTNTDCQVFDSDGGGMSWVSPANQVNDGSAWIVTGSNHADNIGTTAAELVIILPNIKSNICTQINDISGITALGNDGTIDFTKFTGTYVATQTINFAADTIAGCLNYDNGGTDEPFFYQVLISR